MNQRRRLRQFRRNFMLGAFLLGSLLVLTVLTQKLGPFSLKEQKDWTVYFGAESLVEEGVAVMSSGIKVGLVSGVARLPDRELAPDRYVKVTVRIDADLTLWRGAELVIVPRGFLGGYNLNLSRGNPAAEVLTPGTPLRGRVAGTLFDDLAGVVRDNRDNISRTTENLAAIVDRISRGEGTLGKFIVEEDFYRTTNRVAERLDGLLADLQSPDSSLGLAMRERGLYDEIYGTARNARELLEGVRAGRGTVGRLFSDDAMGAKVDDAVTALRDVLRGIEEGQGTLGLLLKDDTVHKDLAAGVQSLRRFAERIEHGDGTLSKLLTDDEVYENVRIFTANLRAISEDVQAGKGTIGLLLKDESAYRELQRLLESFRESGEIARENAPLASLTSFTSLFFNVLN